MEKTTVADAIAALTPAAVEATTQAGTLFAQSEVNAAEALEVYARAIGEPPTFDAWIAARTNWIAGYIAGKRNVKANSADAAFKRFKDRLVEAYGITVPKADSVAAGKKRDEREAKLDKLLTRFKGNTDAELIDLLQQQYTKLAKDPTKPSAIMRELQTAVRLRTKDADAERTAALKAKRDAVIAQVRACDDMDRLQAASDVLDDDAEVTVRYMD